jgi:hypothetical protein
VKRLADTLDQIEREPLPAQRITLAEARAAGLPGPEPSRDDA